MSTALDRLHALYDPESDPEGDRYLEVRNAMIDPEDPDVGDEVRDLVVALDRETLSVFALELSLCPLHLIDYAACFDDEDPECAAIRHCFPSHDT
jgi:hypothetical protein